LKLYLSRSAYEPEIQKFDASFKLEVVKMIKDQDMSVSQVYLKFDRQKAVL